MPNLIPLVSALVLGLVLVSPLAAQENPKPIPSVGWIVRYTARAHPSPDREKREAITWPIKTAAGTALERYNLSFDASGLFVSESDGKIAFTQDGTFRHEAAWKAEDGKAKDYLFNGRGTLIGKGEIDAAHLKLKLEWKSGPGRGKSSGKPLAAPVADHANTSEWDLKPTKIRVRFGTAKWQEVPGYSGSRSTMMPQHLAGCGPLPLVERIEIYQAPSADLEVAIKDDPDPGVVGGKCGLTVSIKNLGPDPCPPFELNLSLPKGILVTLPKDAQTVKGGFTTLLFPLEDLAKDAVTTVKIEFQQVGELPPKQKEVSVASVATLTSRVFDPNPVNNGHIELTTFRETKAGGPAAAVAEDVKPLETVKGWGLVVDPLGDCTFSHQEGKFTIKVPGAYHDLWPVKGKVNAAAGAASGRRRLHGGGADRGGYQGRAGHGASRARLDGLVSCRLACHLARCQKLRALRPHGYEQRWQGHHRVLPAHLPRRRADHVAGPGGS